MHTRPQWPSAFPVCQVHLSTVLILGLRHTCRPIITTPECRPTPPWPQIIIQRLIICVCGRIVAECESVCQRVNAAGLLYWEVCDGRTTPKHLALPDHQPAAFERPVLPLDTKYIRSGLAPRHGQRCLRLRRRLQITRTRTCSRLAATTAHGPRRRLQGLCAATRVPRDWHSVSALDRARPVMTCFVHMIVCGRLDLVACVNHNLQLFHTP